MAVRLMGSPLLPSPSLLQLPWCRTYLLLQHQLLPLLDQHWQAVRSVIGMPRMHVRRCRPVAWILEHSQLQRGSAGNTLLQLAHSALPL